MVRLAAELGLDRLMFEAADPRVRMVRQKLRHVVNLFVGHSQIVQLEALRSGVWSDTGAWGWIVGLP